jgi:hypothetical protein
MTMSHVIFLCSLWHAIFVTQSARVYFALSLIGSVRKCMLAHVYMQACMRVRACLTHVSSQSLFFLLSG